MFRAFVLIIVIGLTAVYASDADSGSPLYYLFFPVVALICALALFYWFLLFVFKVRMQRAAQQNGQAQMRAEDKSS